jgi:DHA2 family multidrug resistance protein
MMPTMGSLIRRGFPPKLMMITGFCLFFVSAQMLSHLNLAAGESDFFWPMILRGFGLGMLFVPFTTLALAGLSQRDTHQATGLTNMMRQLGGSTGVALMATFIQHRNWTHRQNLLSRITPYDSALRERLNGIVHGFITQGSSLTEARRQALAAIDAMMSRQALLLTYLDAFRIVGVMFLFCIPLILLFRRPRSPATVPAAH